MIIPPFEDFLRSLGPDPGDSLIAEALRDDELLADASPVVVVGSSYSITLMLLKRYHQWLWQQIAASSD